MKQFKILQHARHFVLIFLSWLSPVSADTLAVDSLLSQSHVVLNKIKHSVIAESLHVSSEERGAELGAEVYGIVAQPLYELSSVLQESGNWCEFIPLTPNVKSCTHYQTAGKTHLRFYVGRKYYEAPKSAYQFDYNFNVVEARDDYFKILLTAKDGPVGTSNYLIQVEGMALDTRSLVRVRMAYKTSWASRALTSTYLATLGRNKVGFSVVGSDANRQPIYARGVQGIVERNVMRYYLALQAFLDTAHLSKAQRFDANLQTWFDRADIYRAQLYELERDEYIEIKHKERRNQLMQQKLLHITWQKSKHAG